MTVMQIVGVRPTQFKASQGDNVSGQNVYMIYPLDKGEGHGTDRVFLTDSKLVKGGYAPRVGDYIEVQYNRFGKCDGIVPVPVEQEG